MSRSQQADLLIIMISVDELNTNGNIGIDSEIQRRVEGLLKETLQVCYVIACTDYSLMIQVLPMLNFCNAEYSLYVYPL